MTETSPRDAGHSPSVSVSALNHVNLVVRDVDSAVGFYRRALGLRMHHAQSGITFLNSPGAEDLLALQAQSAELDRVRSSPRVAGSAGGVDHIGFVVADTDVLDRILNNVESAGGTVHHRFREPRGAYTAFVSDIDGYLIQLTTRSAGGGQRPRQRSSTP